MHNHYHTEYTHLRARQMATQVPYQRRFSDKLDKFDTCFCWVIGLFLLYVVVHLLAL